MREIKFRAWNHTVGEMQPIEEIHFSILGDIHQVNTLQDHILFPNKECELMQYTGLKDKNGVEIYEGDVVTDGGRKAEVYQRRGHWFGGRIFLSDLYSTEVIGNIYENPELLKGTN